MSDMKELNTAELESTAGGKNDSDPFRVIHLPWGGCCGLYSEPINSYRYDIPEGAMYEGDHYVIIGEPVNDMYPVRVLKNGATGYIHACFVL